MIDLGWGGSFNPGDNVKNLHLTLITGGLLLLSACSNPFQMEGGPCKYESSLVTAKAVVIHDNVIEFEGEMENFNIRKSAFKTLPEVGDRVTFTKDTITKGTCTPEMYRVANSEENAS